jgi:uncharacterized protein YjbJ (UPF0337 family)
MAKSARRDTTEGTLDRIAGRAMEAWGKLTGKTKTKAKGKGARARGSTRRAKGRTKRAAR